MIITAVNYLNTLPFIYGIEQAASELRGALRLAVPSACADAIINGNSDISLVPVADIPKVRSGRIITNFCLSADGEVDTVALLSNTPIEKIHTIYLDSHSRTSVQLVRVLARELWAIAPRWVDNSRLEMELLPGEAIVAIGDKVFDIEHRYVFKHDLSAGWKQLTGMPFVFAAWVAVTPKGIEIADQLDKALQYGVQHIAQSITDTHNKQREYPFERSYNYLTQSLEFDLTQSKCKAMELFWEKILMPG